MAATGAQVNTKTRAQLTAGALNDDDIITGLVNYADDLAGNDTITAYASGGQTSAVLLVAGINNITTAAANASVKLPASNIVGTKVVVRNSGANAAVIYPFLDDKINALSANSGLTVQATYSQTFHLISIVSGVRKWVSDFNYVPS